MQTRRRLQTLSDHVQLQSQTNLDETNPLIAGQTYGDISESSAYTGTTGTTLVGKRSGEQVSLLIGGDSNSKTSLSLNIDESASNIVDSDDKYQKAERQWNLRTISSRLQASSGSAIRSFITNPLSAAASAVKGNFRDSCDYQQVEELPTTSYTNTKYCEDYRDIIEDLETTAPITVMAARDRTGEFNNAIRSFQSRNISRAINIRDPRKAKHVQSYAEFMMIAKLIGKNIASTYAKLEKLTMLAKKKSLFDDRPEEIQELTYIIKSDLNALNQQIARLQEISKNQRRNLNGKHLISHSSNMVLALQSKLANMSTDFKNILEVRTENLKHQRTRRDQFGQVGLPVNVAPPSTSKQSSLLLSEENQTVCIEMPGGNDSSGGRLHNQQQQQQLMIYDESEKYVQERAETMQNIESTIVELGGIFQQLAHMVKEQEEIVERIDTNIQDAELNVDAAHGEILKYFQSVSRNRWLMIKIFGVLIFFFIVFVVFMT